MPSNFAMTPRDAWKEARKMSTGKGIRAMMVFVIAYCLNAPISIYKY